MLVFWTGDRYLAASRALVEPHAPVSLWPTAGGTHLQHINKLWRADMHAWIEQSALGLRDPEPPHILFHVAVSGESKPARCRFERR